MLEDKFEIVLITYNRYKDLDNTLKQVLDSPFYKCKLTILDNLSTDKTPEVCAKYQKLYPNMEIIRHKRNIGGNANILRAVETSNSLYTWILCDDDEYDFSDCDDVLKSIESEETDIIILSSKHYLSGFNTGLITSSKDLVENNFNYFGALSFVPSMIFKTEKFDSDSIEKGYFNIYNQYPHFPFINKSLEEDFSIYLSRSYILTPGITTDYIFSALFWLTSWLNSCSTIKDRDLRRRTIYESPQFSLVKTIIIGIVEEKIKTSESRKYIQFISAFFLAFWLSIDVFLIFLILPLVLIPGFIYRSLLRIYIILNPHKKIPDRSYSLDEVR